ncbi:ATP-binding cassette domain-containing protein [Streptomyces venezuelae]|uniref:ATP-binding cassette domain-containing protein n=1 Tax=Streptomyces venezuelae TaxID=54571 RepID=UPI001681E6F6|nr:ATP-binding cassette domain-containing protein [Streptomyces venezuelae]
MIQAIGLTSNPRQELPPAVEDVSFEARTGRVTALLDAESIGATTALRLMLELQQGRGVTYFRGRPLHRIAHPSREVGVLLGDVPGHPARSVRGHLRMLCAAMGVPVLRADDVLEAVGLVSLRDERLGTLSRGMDRRLGLACALLADPHTLVLDGPGEGLSAREAAWLHGILRAHASQGGTVLFSTCDPKEAARAADRVVTLDAGRLVADQEAADFARTRLRPRVAVRTPHAARLGALLAKEARAGHRSIEVVKEDGNRLSVYGSTCADVGETAYRHSILVHQLADETGDAGPPSHTSQPWREGRQDHQDRPGREDHQGRPGYRSSQNPQNPQDPRDHQDRPGHRSSQNPQDPRNRQDRQDRQDRPGRQNRQDRLGLRSPQDPQAPQAPQDPQNPQDSLDRQDCRDPQGWPGHQDPQDQQDQRDQRDQRHQPNRGEHSEHGTAPSQIPAPASAPESGPEAASAPAPEGATASQAESHPAGDSSDTAADDATGTADVTSDVPGDAPTDASAAPGDDDTAPLDTASRSTAPPGPTPLDTTPLDTAPSDTVPLDTAPLDADTRRSDTSTGILTAAQDTASTPAYVAASASASVSASGFATAASALPPPITVRPGRSPLRPLRYEVRRLLGVGTGYFTLAAVLATSALFSVFLARSGHTPQSHLLAAWPHELPLPPAALGAGLLGALAFGDEFRHPALAADRGTVPRRLGMLGAKLLVAAVTALLLSTLAVVSDAVLLHLVYGEELTKVPADWPSLSASWYALVTGCAWAGVLAAGVFRSTTAGLAAVLAVPIVVVPLVQKAVEGPSVRSAAGLPARLRDLALVQWPFGAERYLTAGVRMIAQPVGTALMLSLTALLCAYVLTAMRTRVR